jgi:hypothetical protein
MQKVLFISLITASLLTGCSSAYQTGQTPDDLYYSPGKDINASEVRRQNEDEERYQQNVSTIDDRYLRMKVANRNQWSDLDDFSYWNDMRFNFSPGFNTIGFNNFQSWNMHPNFNSPWNIGWNTGWNFGLGINPWNSFGGWGNQMGWGNHMGMGWGNQMGWNNPMFTLISYSNPRAIAPTSTSGSNLAGYRNRNFNNLNSSNKLNEWATPGNANNNRSFGSLIRSVISTPSNGNGSSSSYDRPARTFQSNGSGSMGTSSSAGGSSGGFGSTGSSAGSGRAGRGN